jgi:hypothetical protein
VFDDLAPHKLVGPNMRPVPVPEAMPLTCAVQAFLAGIRDEGREAFGLDSAVEIVRILQVAQGS